MSEDPDNTMSMIEATNALVQIAKPLRAFYLALIDEGFDKAEAFLLTTAYLKSMNSAARE